MKKLLLSLLVILISFTFSLNDVYAQNTQKQKNVKVKIIKDEKGNIVKNDTLVWISDNDDGKSFRSVVNTDDNIIVISNDDSTKNVKVFISDDGSGFDMVESPNKLKKTFQIKKEISSQPTDIELRDAGIKNKPDRLKAESIDLNIDNGLIDLAFKLNTDKKPKVVVYNIYGDKVVKAKPELIDGVYELKIDMSVKQEGTYYLQIIAGDSSHTERIKI